MIDPKLKRALGQAVKGVEVVAATHEGITRAYTSHWVTQVSFEEPIIMASVSPKHDTYPLMKASGEYTVSFLAGDQVHIGQYFSYPGRKFHYIAPEYLAEVDGHPVVPDCLAWVHARIFQTMPMRDHELMFADVVEYGYGRLREPPLVYSSRHGWRVANDKARAPGASPRDELLARLAAAGFATVADEDTDDE
ncbi:MAG: flavin reductase family protein [Ilumatobacteraceae bacterium]